MDFDSPAPNRTMNPNRLSPSGQMIGWSIFGTLVVAGFAFGVVAGYERPKTIVAKAQESPKPIETAKADGVKSGTKGTAESPVSVQPATTPKDVATPRPSTMKPKDEPKPPKVDSSKPITAMPKADPPKPDPPKPSVTPVPKTEPPKPDVTPPKIDPNLKPVSFKTEVLPILRTHCLNCHGATGKAKGDVDLTSLAKLKNSTGSPGKILVSGKPEQSDIYTSITERDMPSGGKKKPSPAELLVLKNWILTGAKERRRRRR